MTTTKCCQLVAQSTSTANSRWFLYWAMSILHYTLLMQLATVHAFLIWRSCGVRHSSAHFSHDVNVIWQLDWFCWQLKLPPSQSLSNSQPTVVDCWLWFTQRLRLCSTSPPYSYKSWCCNRCEVPRQDAERSLKRSSTALQPYSGVKHL